MIYVKVNNEIWVYFPFKGDDYRVSVITVDENGLYVFTDVLFAFEHVVVNGDLETLKLDIERFYGSKDSIGRIEDKYIYDD